jgi:hypothetical protein
MKHRKNGISALLVALALAGGVFASSQPVAAEGEEVTEAVLDAVDEDLSPIQTYVDALPLSPMVFPHFKGPALYVPFTSIAQEFGATLEYKEETQETVVKFGTRYAILREGLPYMVCGATTADGTAYATVSLKKLEAAPYRLPEEPSILLTSHDTVVQAFNTKVAWTPETRTIFITRPVMETPAPPKPEATATPAQQPAAPLPTPIPAPPKPVVNPAFATSPYFQEVSGRRAQDMHDFKNKFVLIYYNSTNFEAAANVASLREAAQLAAVKYPIVGVDESSPQYLDNDVLTWIWEYIPRDATRGTKIFVHNTDGKVEFYTAVPTQAELVTILQRLENPMSVSPTPSPTPTPTAGPSATPTPTGPATDTYGIPTTWQPLDSSASKSKMDRGERFIFVYVNPNHTDYDRRYVDAIAEAARAANNATVFYSDPYSYTNSWWGNDVYGSNIPNGTLFLVRGSASNVLVNPLPQASEVTTITANMLAL